MATRHLFILTAAVVTAVGPALWCASSRADDVTAAAANVVGTSSRRVSVYRALATNMPSISVDGISLGKVLDYVHNITGVNIDVQWKVLESANVTKDTPITLTLNNVSLHKVLRLILDQASPEKRLVYTVDSNVLSITTEEEADKALVTRVYIVDDLVMPDNTNVQPPQLNLQAITSSGSTSGGGGGGGGGGGAGGGSLFQDTQTQNNTSTTDTPEKRGNDLVQLIETVVRPTIWRDNGGNATIKYFSGKLIVSAPASVQEAIGGPMSENGQMK